MTTTWRALSVEIDGRLPSSPNETRLILLASASLPWAALAAHFDDPAPPESVAAARRMAAERRSGLPLQWVLGTWGFRTIDVAVDKRALVPRPETEQVVEEALAELDRLAAGPHADRAQLALDLGTGSGVIALSLAVERPSLEVVAVDRSPEALSLAAENLARLAEADPTLAARVRFVEGDWYGPVDPGLAGCVDVVVANPPYLAEAEWPELDPVVRDHDPREALVSGPSGLEAIEAVVSGAPRWLRPGGAVVVELAPAQEGAGCGVAKAAGFVGEEVRRDLAGRPRVLVAHLDSAPPAGRVSP